MVLIKIKFLDNNKITVYASNKKNSYDAFCCLVDNLKKAGVIYGSDFEFMEQLNTKLNNYNYESNKTESRAIIIDYYMNYYPYIAGDTDLTECIRNKLYKLAKRYGHLSEFPGFKELH